MVDPTVSLVLATSTGGVGTHVRSLARGLAGTGWRVRVSGPAETNQLFDFTGVGVEFVPVTITGAAADLRALRSLRKSVSGSAIVHAHGIRAGAVAVLAGRRPLVVTWHNAVAETTVGRRALSAAAERLVARGSTVNLAASEDLAGRIRELGGRDVRDGPIGVAPQVPQRSAGEVRAEFGLEPGQALVLAVGRLHPQKGLDTLISAAASWSADEVLVAIAGDGPLRATLTEQIRLSGAPVRLLGRRTDVPDLLAAADLVVLPSRWEARSLAAQEALLAGRPLVATTVGGLPKLLGTGAVLVAPEDSAGIDSAVRGLLTDPTRRAELVTRGTAQAAGWPGELDTVAQVSALYDELLGR